MGDSSDYSERDKFQVEMIKSQPVKMIYDISKLNEICYDKKSAEKFELETELNNKEVLFDYLSKKFPDI